MRRLGTIVSQLTAAPGRRRPPAPMTTAGWCRSTASGATPESSMRSSIHPATSQPRWSSSSTAAPRPRPATIAAAAGPNSPTGTASRSSSPSSAGATTPICASTGSNPAMRGADKARPARSPGCPAHGRPVPARCFPGVRHRPLGGRGDDVVMLATYPELFAGGAVIAGLPFASANNLPKALERMRGPGSPPAAVLAARVTAAADHGRRSPALAVWHGTSDTVVAPANAAALVDQWRAVHGLGAHPGMVEMVDGHRRETWRDAQGICSSNAMTSAGWATARPSTPGAASPVEPPDRTCSMPASARPGGSRSPGGWSRGRRGSASGHRPPERPERPELPPAPAAPRPTGPGAVIEDALRAAGLMR